MCAETVPPAVPLPGTTELDRLIARSRAIGARGDLVLHGGGNTSSKTVGRDHLGRERPLLLIKGSGADLATLAASGVAKLYLDELLPLRDRAAMTDEEMVDYLARCAADPGGVTPSIETLLHAFLPFPHVDHVHADAVCALSNHPRGEDAIREALGDDVGIVSYVRPGFELARRVAALSGARAVVLRHHGLVTWGNAHEETLTATFELSERASRYLGARLGPRRRAARPPLPPGEVEDLLTRLRGRLSAESHVVLHVDTRQRALADRPDVGELADVGRATPDHILNIGARSAVVAGADQVDDAVDAFRREAVAAVVRCRPADSADESARPTVPRAVLVPGLGCVTAASSKGAWRSSPAPRRASGGRPRSRWAAWGPT